MNRNLLWKFLLVVLIVGWALYETYPPGGRNVIDVFANRADRFRRDATFTNIVNQARQLDQQFPDRHYVNLREAVGTNSVTNYFPWIDVRKEKDANGFVLLSLQREAAGKIKLGIDLRGGTSFLVEMDTNQLARAEEKSTALANAVEVLRRRVDKLGVAEPVIQPAGANRILIQIPGVTEADKERAKRQIQAAAFLEFRMVHPESAQLIEQGIAEPGYEIMVMAEQRRGKMEVERLLVNRKAEQGLTGKYIKSAWVSRDPVTNEPEILFEMDTEGAHIFAKITKEHVGRRLAIVLDGDLRSAPVIRSEIPGGKGSISGGFDVKEAIDLAHVLENPLEAPVKIIEERSAEPSLGKDSIRSGVRASIYGTIAVAVFMMVFYFFGGLVADFALMLNIVITLGVMCAMQSTFTLPGIAGLMLSIGMAVDANVLIFERLREELAAGKSLRGALAAGYKRAFGTILDSHVTTIISAIVLYVMGTGPIKGFGVTLFWGVAASLFTALVVTRLVFDFLMAKNLMKSLPMLPVLKLTRINFLGFAKPAFAISGLIILVGFGYGFFGRGPEMLSVDFAGGDALTLSLSQRVEVDKLRETIGKLGVGEPTIQYQKPVAGGLETLNITTKVGSADKVEQELAKAFPNAKFAKVGLDRVGPTVGKEIQRSAILAAFFATLGILFYVAIRYEFSFAVAAVIATAHDALITIAIFALAGGQLSSVWVAAILTIIGYSINDKIVILDRIREDLRLGVRGSFRDLINLALNQTLSRTLITGGSVILATLSLYIFGGSVLNDFAFVFLVGVLAGTYSSIFIASPVVLWWHKGQRPSGAAQPLVSGPAAFERAPARQGATP